MNRISIYGIFLEVLLNMSSNRQFLENVWKLLGISFSNGSTIKSSLEFLQKLKVLTENFQMLVEEKISFSVLIQSIFPALIFSIEFTATFRKSQKLSLESKITSLIDQMHVSLIEKGKAKCPDLASRLGLPFRSVVKVELRSRIRQCPQQNFNVTSAGSASTSKIKLTEQCCVSGRFMSAMFLIES